MELIKAFFLAYIGLIILFDIVTLPQVALPGGQLFVSLTVALIIGVLVSGIRSNRTIIWWGLFLLSLLGVFRPTMEYIFARMVPGAANNFFPPFTPPFAVVGFLLMLGAFILLLDPKIRDRFDQE